MKCKIYSIALVCVCIFFSACKNNTGKNKNKSTQSQSYSKEDEDKDREHENEDGMREAAAFDELKTMDPKLHRVPYERLFAAHDYARKLRSQLANAPQGAGGGVTPVWTERGPNNVGGRTRIAFFDPNDATGKTVFIGGVEGGIWKCVNIESDDPQWTPINDFLPNISITSIVVDPNNTKVMYAATGETEIGTRGVGIYKSTDGGNTWSILPSTTNITSINPNPTWDFDYIQRLAIDAHGYVYAASSSRYCNRGGLLRSTNGGTSWQRLLGTYSGDCGTSKDFAGSDVVVSSNGSVFAATNYYASGGRIFKSPDGSPGSFTLLNDGNIPLSGLPAAKSISRVSIACAATDTNYVYLLTESNGKISGIYKTTNAGTDWAKTTAYPKDADPGIPSTDFARGQAWWDLTISVDPFNKNTVYVGGIDLFKTTTGGTAWKQLSHWYGGFGYPYVHADQHYVFLDKQKANRVLFTNDGGIFYSTDGGTTFNSRDLGYRVTQYYACAINPLTGSNNFLAGAQDNGTQSFSVEGLNNTTTVSGGDGAFCHIDEDEPNVQLSSYVYNNYYISNDNFGNYRSVSIKKGGSDVGSFINPTDYDSKTNILYRCDQSGKWGGLKNIPNSVDSDSYAKDVSALVSTRNVSAVKIDPLVNNRVYFGFSGSTKAVILRVDGANDLATSVDSLINITGSDNGAYLSNIEIDPSNGKHMLVSFSNYGVTSVMETTNGGSTWRNVEGNLPDMPIRWVLLNPSNPTHEALVGTELGVWSTDDVSATNVQWVPANDGLANVRVDMLKMRKTDQVVLAATHGRGLFSSDVFSRPAAGYTVNKEVLYLGDSVTFTNTSAKSTSWKWDVDNNGSTESTKTNFTYTFKSPGYHNVKLTINNDNNINIIKTIFVLPDKATPYAAADGGNLETNPNDFGTNPSAKGVKWERGSSVIAGKDGTYNGANAWVTGLNASQYGDFTTAILYTPAYGCTETGSYTLSFYSKYSCEENYDGFRIEYSTDRGVTWNVLGSKATGWYNSKTLGSGDYSAFGTNNDAFFTGIESSFTKHNYTTTSFAGHCSVAFRFVFKSDAEVTQPGVAIDNIEFSGPINKVCYDAVLPIYASVLLNGKNESGFNKLSWTTKGENQLTKYELQRADAASTSSYPNNYPFLLQTIPVNNTNTAGNDNGKYSYSEPLIDITQPVAFYRIRVTEKTGNVFYSNTVKLQSPDNYSIKIMPNPVQKDGSVYVLNSSSYYSITPLTVLFIDASGKVLFTTKMTEWSRSISLAGYASGTYYLRFITADGKVISNNKLVIL